MCVCVYLCVCGGGGVGEGGGWGGDHSLVDEYGGSYRGWGGGMGSGTVGKPKLGRLYLVILVLGSVL